MRTGVSFSVNLTGIIQLKLLRVFVSDAKPHKSEVELHVTATCDCLVVRISIADLLDQASNGDVIVPLNIDFLQQTY